MLSESMPVVVVAWNRCSGQGTCVDVCPAAVFELQELLEHPETLKSVPVKADECTLCMKCVDVCAEDAITVKNE
jgi:NAD-dependent dihydropyrimidine dehydrogenase PreA subunit